MLLLLRIALILAFSTHFLGCESKNSYNPKKDEIILDLNTRISSLQGDLDILQKELEEVEVVLKDPDIDSELRKSIRKEIHEGRRHEKTLEQWIAFLKVRQNKRFKSLKLRKGQKGLQEQVKKEIHEYNIDKKLNTIPRPWLKRYKTAIEL